MSANPLETYADELRRWNKAVNLVSPSTIADLETRHIKDSLQLLEHLPDRPITLMDWGSGGGLPGMVLALSRMDDVVHFVESDMKKCEFLRHVSRETFRPVTVHTKRIEAVEPSVFKPDVLTARALAPLEQLLAWMLPWSSSYPQLIALFPKGKSWREELSQARESFDFTCDDFASTTDPEARILRIENLTAKA